MAKIGSDDHGNVTPEEVEECFANHCGGYCMDRRPQHLDRQGNPTPWFVADTNHGKTLKIMFVAENNEIELKSAYPATEKVQEMFNRHAK